MNVFFSEKILLLCICFTAIPLLTAGQNDQQISIQTEEGVLTVSKTTNGKDMIILSIACWNEITAGTKYSTNNLAAMGTKKICIQLSDKNTGLCSRGIGFGCSIFDCPTVPDPLPNRVDAENRICAVTIKKIKGSIKIIFEDKVNWKSLQNINDCAGIK